MPQSTSHPIKTQHSYHLHLCRFELVRRALHERFGDGCTITFGDTLADIRIYFPDLQLEARVSVTIGIEAPADSIDFDGGDPCLNFTINIEGHSHHLSQGGNP